MPELHEDRAHLTDIIFLWAIGLVILLLPVVGSFGGISLAALMAWFDLRGRGWSGRHQPTVSIYSVSEYLDRWLSDYAKPKVAPKTYERYREMIDGHIRPALGAYLLPKLAPLHIQAFYSHAWRSP